MPITCTPRVRAEGAPAVTGAIERPADRSAGRHQPALHPDLVMDGEPGRGEGRAQAQPAVGDGPRANQAARARVLGLRGAVMVARTAKRRPVAGPKKPSPVWVPVDRMRCEDR
jgi:hypothetical protein